ncbi:DNA-binding transcriptional regulator, MarR family [Spirosomataceae bacterium TFI 002]|nr:DNA-binding transcriptional regulator, MarR family [Spirosomataceae bacterium TFI 002]
MSNFKSIIKELHRKMPFQNEFHRFRVNLMNVSNWLRMEMNTVLEEHDITQQQFNALRILRGQITNPVDGSFSTQDLRERLLDKMSDTSRLVDRLIKKGLIDKKPCDHDARRVHLWITENGLKLLEKLDAQMASFDGITDKISEEEAITLSTILEKLKS